MTKLELLDQIVTINIEEIESGSRLKEAIITRNAIRALKIISELDPEKNTAEEYRDTVRLILVGGGWI